MDGRLCRRATWRPSRVRTRACTSRISSTRARAREHAVRTIKVQECIHGIVTYITSSSSATSRHLACKARRKRFAAQAWRGASTGQRKHGPQYARHDVFVCVWAGGGGGRRGGGGDQPSTLKHGGKCRSAAILVQLGTAMRVSEPCLAVFRRAQQADHVPGIAVRRLEHHLSKASSFMLHRVESGCVRAQLYDLRSWLKQGLPDPARRQAADARCDPGPRRCSSCRVGTERSAKLPPAHDRQPYAR